jgi:hypothetical protein
MAMWQSALSRLRGVIDMNKKRLPIGIEDFEDIINGGSWR